MSSKTTKFEHLLEAVPDALVAMDQKGTVRFVNSQTESLFGYDRDQLIGQPIERLVPEPLWQIYAQNRDQYFSDPRTRSSGLELELVGLHRDGGNIPINISLSDIDTGDVLLVITAIADVAKRRVAVGNAQLIAAIVESSDDAITGSTLGGLVTSWNPAAGRMYGYTSKEMIGRSGSLLASDDRAGEMSAALARIKDDEAVEHLETVHVRKDGTRFPVSLTLSPIRDEEGVVIGACAISRDVTELTHAAEYARSLIEAALDPLVTISPGGKIYDVNEATIKVTGVPRDQLIGTDFTQYFTDPGKAHEGYEQVFERGSVTDYPLTLRHASGALTDVLYNASVYRDFNGEVLGVFAAARDVTDQKKAFEASQRASAIVEFSDDAIVGRTIDGIITSWNPAAERMFGYTSVEIVGRTSDVLIPDDRAGEKISIVAKISAGRPVHDFETIRIRKDGTPFPVSLTISPIRDQNGAVVSASVICRDISKLKHAARYARSLIEAALDPLVTISPEGRIDDVNEATVKITGVPRNKLIGTDFTQYFTDPGRAREGYQKVFARGKVTDYPLTLRHRDGTLTDVLYNASVYHDEGGNVLGVFAAARDVTNQEAAYEATQRMAAIVEYSDEALISNTLDGIITSWNPAAERMFGYTGEEIMGRSGALLSPGDRADEIREVLARVSAGRPVDDFETICTRKDGTTFPVKLTLTPIRDAGGTIVGASAIARDVYAIARDATEPG